MTVQTGTQDSFTELTKDGKVLVDFNADWCGPCQMLKPTIEEFSVRHEEIKVVSVNIDDQPELADQFGVSGIPCLVVLEDGTELKRAVGVMPLKKIEKLVGV